MRRSLGRLPARIRDGTAGLRALSQSHHEFLLLLVLFFFMRLSLLVISRPQGYLDGSSDYDFYLQLGRLSDRGLYPDIHYWTEYPPIFPWIAVAAYRATEALPTLGGDPIFWFRLALGSVLLLFDVGNLLLVYRLGTRLHGPAVGLRSGWIYALLFAPLHVWLGWFDTMPLFFLLLGVALTVEGHRSAAALVSGFGFMVKVFPILALPATVKVEGRFWGRVKLVALAGIAVGIAAAPFLVLAPSYLVASFVSVNSRSPWETVWAIAEGYYGYGRVAPLPDRLDPSTATYMAYPSHLPWPAITAVFAGIYLLLWTRRLDLGQPLKAVAFTGLSLNLFMFYSKGYSPQFLVYLVPFALLVLPQLRAIGYLTALSIINLIEYPIYIVLFKDQGWLMRDLVLMRAAILLLLSWEYLAALELLPSLQRARRLAASGAVLAFVGWAIVALPIAGGEWIRYSQQHDPNSALIDYIADTAGSQSAVVFTNQGLYRALYPYLYQHTTVILMDPAADNRVASVSGANRTDSSNSSNSSDLSRRVGQLSSQYQQIIAIRQMDDIAGRQVEDLLKNRNHLVTNRRMNDLSVTQWSTK